MNRFIENYQGKEFDLIVVGGGITGSTVAYEAASRGLSVALIEKSDFGSATSAATSKMIHGGLRYLSTFEFGLVRESLKERRVLTNIAPNFIHPASFLVAVYKKDKGTNFMLKIGMLLYELFSFDKNRLRDKSKKMPLHKSVSSEQISQLFPNAIKK
ncbi:MAG: FAD-dependent oxidoreductase, partial [Bacteroidales bacterium]|nr:FAD-dependent oxidoreductase [Bacteroidales bacterium]